MRKLDQLKTLAVNLGLAESVDDVTGDTLGEVLNFIATGINSKPIPSEILIQSSTPDSTKEFKITVTDDGTISATEVTE